VRRVILELVNLTGFERKFPWQCKAACKQRGRSGGGVVRSGVLLMDEAVSAAHEIVRDPLNEQLLQLWDKTGTTCC